MLNSKFPTYIHLLFCFSDKFHQNTLGYPPDVTFIFLYIRFDVSHNVGKILTNKLLLSVNVLLFPTSLFECILQISLCAHVKTWILSLKKLQDELLKHLTSGNWAKPTRRKFRDFKKSNHDKSCHHFPDSPQAFL